jgi:hypothetical protein
MVVFTSYICTVAAAGLDVDASTVAGEMTHTGCDARLYGCCPQGLWAAAEKRILSALQSIACSILTGAAHGLARLAYGLANSRRIWKFLCARAKITRINDANLDAADAVGPVNNFSLNLFTQVNIPLNGTLLTSSMNMLRIWRTSKCYAVL